MLELIGQLVLSLLAACIALGLLYFLVATSKTSWKITHPVAQWLHDRLKKDHVNPHNINATVLLFLSIGMSSFVFVIYYVLGFWIK